MPASTLMLVNGHHKYRRNPLSLQGLKGSLSNAGIGAAGAMAVNAVYNTIAPTLSTSVPTLVTAPWNYIVKGALAIALAGVGHKMSPKIAIAAEGALTVAIADMIRAYAAASGITVLSGAGWLSPGIRFNPASQPLDAKFLANKLGAGALGKYLRMPAKTPMQQVKAAANMRGVRGMGMYLRQQ
jgi:hypothetical protein